MDLFVLGALFGFLLGYIPWYWYPRRRRLRRKGGTLQLSGLQLSGLDIDKKDS